MRRKIASTIVGAVLCTFGLNGVAHAATMHVRCKTSALIAAITTANATPGTTLSLARGCVYKLRPTVAPISGDGLPELTSTTTIVGHGATIERKSSVQFRILEIGFAANVTLRSLTIKGGRAPDGISGGFGGGIFNSGVLTLQHVTVTHNRAGDSSGPGGTFSGGGGGGIFNGVGATLTAVRSRVVSNRGGRGGPDPTTPSAGGSGGGIFSFGALTVTRSTVAHNVTGPGGLGGAGNGSGGFGGGIAISIGPVPVISRSLITRNKTAAGGIGGGIYTAFITVNPTKTRIVRNHPDNCEPSGFVANCRH